MLAECPSFEGGGGEYAESGTIRHQLLNECLRAESAQEEQEILDTADTDEDREAVRWAVDYIRLHAPMADYQIEFEQTRTWMGPDFSERTGTPDVTCGPHIFDFKWRVRNYEEQMADYALERFERGHEVVTVHLLFGASKRAERIVFTREAAEAVVEKVLDKANDPNAQPNPCDYCGWCAKRMTCPALAERVNAVAKARDDWALETYHASEILTPEEMGKALKLARQLKQWIEAVEYHAEKMVGNGLIPAGFKVQNRRGNRFVSSVIDAYGRVGMPQEEFLKLCNVSFGDLVKYTVGKDGISKKAAERELETKLGEVLQRAKSSTSLVSAKDAE